MKISLKRKYFFFKWNNLYRYIIFLILKSYSDIYYKKLHYFIKILYTIKKISYYIQKLNTYLVVSWKISKLLKNIYKFQIEKLNASLYLVIKEQINKIEFEINKKFKQFTYFKEFLIQ